MAEKQFRVIQEKYRTLCPILDERGRRIWAAAEAKSLPYGGISLVSKATGISRTTIHLGMGELGRGKGKPGPCWAEPQARRRPQTSYPGTARHPASARRIGGTYRPRGPRISPALDL